MAESRVKKTLLNARVNLIFYFLTLVLSFFSRKIFLDCLGANFIGLTGTLQNLLGFLNLAELGIGSAIGFVLYKPLYDHDEEKICEIISVMGYLYRWIGLIILAGGCILACFLPLIFPDTGFSLPLIYFAYFSFLTSSLIGYFINYRQNLLSADQRNYVVMGYYQTVLIVKTLIQLLLAYYTKSYFLWVAIELTFGIIYSFILNWRINRTYPWLRTEVLQGRALLKKYPVVITKIKQMFIHRIGCAVQYQTRPLLIYSFVSLPMVAIYGNYNIIVDKLYQLLSNLLRGMNASVGNLIAEGNETKIQNVFWELFSARTIVYSTMAFSLYHLINPFIKLWLGEEYLFGLNIVGVIVAYILVDQYRDGIGIFLNGYGLVGDVWAPVVESVIYLAVSIVGGHYLGLFGVLLGPVVSSFIIMFIWKPYYLFTRGFNKPLYFYWLNNAVYIVLTAFSAVVSTYLLRSMGLLSNMSTLWSWTLSGVCVTLMFAVMQSVLFYIFTKGGRMFINRLLRIRHA